MANEYLRRTPTSTGNRRVYSFSFWTKLQTGAAQIWRLSNTGIIQISADSGTHRLTFRFQNTGTERELETSVVYRDPSSWIHFMFVADSTSGVDKERMKIFVNGVRVVSLAQESMPTINELGAFNTTSVHGLFAIDGGISPYSGLVSDIFMVDGQALTPDVFGFYKEGKGYISAGSTQSTDFRPGQWVPKTPRVIKTEINRRGGFGVNGFYLPMNDSSNFGADFHTTPNSIITLKGEDLPQPRNGAPTTSDSYVSQLRSDPYAANLVLAVPGISGGQGSGYGDYSADIKGSGSNKTITAGGGVGVAVTASYYGSAIFFDGTDDYLTTNTSTDFQLGSSDFTVEAWVKYKSGNGADTPIVLDNTTTTYAPLIGYLNANLGHPHLYLSSTGSSWDIASGVAFGPVVNVDQWTHLAISRQGTNISLYRDGVGVGIITDVGSKSIYQGSNQISLGLVQSNKYFDGHIQDLRIYKGVAKYKGGFDVPKPYTPVGIATWRAVPDCTANNFATLNPLSYQTTGTPGTSYPVLSDGNLKFTHGQTGHWERSNASFGVGEGKWYYEFEIVTRTTGGTPPNNSENWAIGIRESDSSLFYNCTDGFEDSGDHVYWIDANTAKIVSNQDRSLGSTSGISGVSNGDIINVAFEKTSTTLKTWFGINGTYFNSGNPGSGTNPAVNHSTTTEYIIPSAAFYQYTGQSEPVGVFNFGQNPTFSGNTTAGTYTDSNGKGLFKYQPPSGFLALCEDNLPTPAIKDPGEHFKTVLYTGDGNTRSITGIGFTPDLVWIKSRNASLYHLLTNSVTGVDNTLSTNTTDAESFSTERVLNSFDSDGFSLNVDDGSGYYGWNVNGQNMVAWCWRAGAGTTSTNTDGSIQSVVSVNQDAGFSIVSWSGTGSAGTIGHGLGKTPAFRIIKYRDSSANWYVWHKSLAANEFLILNQTTAKTGSSSLWNNTLPTSTTISYTTATAGDRFIEYVWAEIEGFSKAFSYVGNGSADGPLIYLNFKPAFILYKSSTRVENWEIYDSSRQPTNPATMLLKANTSDIEAAYLTTGIDVLSNGFKIRDNATRINSSGDTYIGIAFAESPFQTANSK